MTGRQWAWMQILSRARNRAHRAFDPLWLCARGRRAQLREAAYVWLAAQLGKSRDATHIGRFDTHECGRVVRICTAYRERQGTIPCD